ncbi:sensor histidine kinase [Brevibacillus reuszeri]|uniref:sensor histidine kinase n=1 Tax=Brevibacillus reuszeri TaxID=54915 RepID=UPI002896EE43|nr:ATP-binding protein [Brevibacillus reuszeri]
MKNNNDLFRKTRTHLSVMNSFILIIFLLLFIIGILGVLFYIIYNEQKLELEALTQQEINELQVSAPTGTSNHEGSLGNRGMYINYFLKANGDLIVGDEFIPSLRPVIIERVKGWNPDIIKVKYETFTYGNNQEIQFLIAAQNVFEKGVFVGTVYFGKDISYLWSMFQWFLAVLLGMSLLFAGIAIAIGQFMTSRAMKPITRSYRMQREFLANASHELRTPISILKSGLEVIDMEEGSKFSEFTFELLKDLQKEAKSAAKMVSDLMLLARSDAGVQQISYESFDFSQMAEQVMRSIQGFAHVSQIKLNLQTQGSILLFADQERIKQLLYILLDNAVKYTPYGGEITLYYGLMDAEHTQKLCISVTDTGIGIESEHIAHIFDRFYRVDKNRSRESGGTGLGLAIAKWIVESHRGSIQVSSTPGAGTSFTILLPLK